MARNVGLRSCCARESPSPARTPASPKALPDLDQPVLAGITPSALVQRGFERLSGDEGSYGVIQEWHCELPSEPR